MKYRIPYAPLLSYSVALIGLALLMGTVRTHLDMADPSGVESRESRSLLEDADVRIYNGQGRATYRLRSTKLWYFAGSGNIDFSDAKVLYYTQNNSTLEMSAQQGVMNKAEDKIYLDDDVRVIRFNKDRSEKTLDTHDMVIDLKKEVAHSKQRAVINDGKSKVVGVGITLNLANGEMTLHSQAKTTYVR